MAASPENSGHVLTVAVPTYNGAPHLAEAIRSILAQREVSFDLVVSDDRSDDNSLEVVRAVAGDRARVAVNPERLGLADNWNRCVAMAGTPLVAIFHQDDVMGPGHLASHLAAFAGDAAIGLVASASEVIDERGDPVPETIVGRGGLGPVDRVFPAGTLAAAMVEGNPLRCSAVTIRRDAFQDVGGFDPTFRYVLDWDFWLRVSRRWKTAWLARPTVYVRWHPASETHCFKVGLADLDEAAQMMERLLALDLKGHPSSDRLRTLGARRLARAFLSRAQESLRDGRPDAALQALRRALRRAPTMVSSLLRDPRLGIQMAALLLSPTLAGRWFGPRTSRGDDRRLIP